MRAARTSLLALAALSVAAIVSIFGVSTAAFSEPRPAAIGIIQFEPCRFWRYDFDANAYTCRYTDRRVGVADGRDTQREIDALLQKIADLETRVKQLEDAGQ